jgi:hypothetical protein
VRTFHGFWLFPQDEEGIPAVVDPRLSGSLSSQTIKFGTVVITKNLITIFIRIENI